MYINSIQREKTKQSHMVNKGNNSQTLYDFAHEKYV